ncbi:uncharacterized protein LOC131145598 [Malania oleifera]|uniref:uncharacterized protein LOC131145598 n=1 Tax=Malania oleifera TaxID=397392 RepID=UPI0025AE2C49|nr:uncharacterized protein LOC131145598 [Malania oleifera]XP_057950754.1 uncharacterized protein LOC131145598 [Malania oleifera]XP_057950755.1 uncharacterized protein LOC131145598 [Malania oleifera]
MLVWRCKFTNVALHAFPLGNFVEHLSTFKANKLRSCTITPKTLATPKTLKCAYFETLNSSQKDQIHLYVDTLLKWNQKMNLTAVREANEVMERHVEDSLAIIPPILSSYTSHCINSCDNLSLVDVGSGPGLPGLILAIACPDWKVTLLESMSKRCVFLEHAINLIGLSNVVVVRGRAENLGQDLGFRETFDVAVARAVAEMRILVEYCIPFVRVGGLFVAAKGHDPQEEVRNAERAIRLMGASVLQQCSVESQSLRGQRTAIVCTKDRPTPRRYPRDTGIPGKSPL